ncbi:hypothetical protein [Kibdelosporangium philippinense]
MTFMISATGAADEPTAAQPPVPVSPGARPLPAVTSVLGSPQPKP